MTKKATKNEKAASIETQLEQIQALVARMEGGELSLDDTLSAFEQGVKLIREAQANLAEAEQKIQLLTEQGEEPVATAFSEEDS